MHQERGKDIMKRIKDINSSIDEYYNREMECIEKLKHDRDSVGKHFGEISDGIKKEQAEVEERINSLKAELEKKNGVTKRQQTEHQTLVNEVEDLPKSINYYKFKLEALEDKARRLRPENIDNNNTQNDHIHELDVYRKLYGVDIKVHDKQITFTVKDSYVTLGSEQGKFTLVKSSLPIEVPVARLVDELNKTQQILPLIKCIRESTSNA